MRNVLISPFILLHGQDYGYRIKEENKKITFYKEDRRLFEITENRCNDIILMTRERVYSACFANITCNDEVEIRIHLKHIENGFLTDTLIHLNYDGEEQETY